MLNQFLQRTELEHLVTPESPKQPEPEVLENPELASAMREGTKVIHRAAETSVFTKQVHLLLYILFTHSYDDTDVSSKAISIQMSMVDTSTLCILSTGICTYYTHLCRMFNTCSDMLRYMEGLLEEYKEHPVVKLIYFPIELNRREALEKG